MENIYNEDKQYYRLPLDDKNKKEEEILIVDPNWVGLGRIKLRSDGTRVFDPIYVPENLVDDILNGNIDPEKYTREQLRRMSLNRQQQQGLIEEYDRQKQNFEEVKNQDKISYNIDGNSKKL